MGKTISEKIISSHLVEGEMVQGREVGIRIDQTLTQDATGTMAYLAFEALEMPRVKTELSVSYIDHNTLQGDFKNADDHLFLQSTAKKFGLYCSRPGNGICHSVHYQRFAAPGKTLLGSDSHTPTSGAVGSLAMGAGGMSVAMAMAGELFYLKMPKIVKVSLKGNCRPGVTPKDISLEILRRLSVKGGLGRIFEYVGEGVSRLSIPERATITNMGTELGATTSIFQSDSVTKAYLKAQGRAEDFTLLLPDEDAVYDEEIEIDLPSLVPMVAKPHMPDLVENASALGDVRVNQVFIGSCTNASYEDLARAAKILEGQRIHENVSLSVAPGSKQVFEMIARDGILQTFISCGARILESACGPCVGIGQAPNSGGVSLRTSNRNFRGRSGTKDARVYLCSPETAAWSAIKGFIADPTEFSGIEAVQQIREPDNYIIDDRMLAEPAEDSGSVEIYRGPNIQPMPIRGALDEVVSAPVILKVEDNITTDDIMPAGAKILPLRSNVPEISKYVYSGIDSTFYERAKELGKSIIIAGENYGQGSSREHAALAPMYLGVQAVICKSMARIHNDNLINYGILPLVFKNPEDYESIEQGDELEISGIEDQLSRRDFTVLNKTKDLEFKATANLSDRQCEMLKAGGQLNFVRLKNRKVEA